MTDPDLVAAIITRDKRFATLHEAIAVEGDMRDNPTIKAFIAAIRANADLAMLELADTSPVDTKAVSALMVRVRAYVEIKRMIEMILQRGKNAEHEIRMEDQRFDADHHVAE